jgi:two-component system, sensor histidine kinase and response regulator
VALTAHALEGSREMSLAAGMNDHLTKPLTLSVLTSKLLEWLGAGGTAGPQEA